MGEMSTLSFTWRCFASCVFLSLVLFVMSSGGGKIFELLAMAFGFGAFVSFVAGVLLTIWAQD